jgi:hypothetical protein
LPPCPIDDQALEAAYQKELRDTAYHEAGHSFLYVLFGLPFETAEIFTDEHPEPPGLEGYAGIVRSNYLDDWPFWAYGMPEGAEAFDKARAYDHADKTIMILLAGELSESIVNHRRYTPGVRRYDNADIRWIGEELLARPHSETKTWVNRLRPLTMRLLQTPGVWAAVQAIAQALLAKHILTASEVRALVN